MLVRCNIRSLPLGIHREVHPPAEAVVFLVFPCFLGREHRAAGHTGCIELIISFFGIVKSVDPVGDDLLYKGMVLAAVRHRHKARIFLVFGMPHAVAKCVPRCGRYCADDHGHGFAGVNTVGAEIRIVVAAAPLNMTHVVVYLQSAGVYVQNIAHERKIDKLAAAGLELMDISKQRRCKHTLCAAGIAYNGADTRRCSVGIAGLGVYAAHRHRAYIIGGLVAVLRRLHAKRGKRGIDYAGIDLTHFLIAQTELFQKAGLI